jgi:hypothetical protein
MLVNAIFFYKGEGKHIQKVGEETRKKGKD